MLTFSALATGVALISIFRYSKSFVFAYGLPVLIFSLAIDLNFFSVWEFMYVKGRVENTLGIIWYWLVFFFSWVIFSGIVGKGCRRKKFIYGDLWEMRLGVYIFATLSLLAASYNFAMAGDVSLLFSEPRAWELTFGRNVITNYLYFLHLPALVLLGIIIGTTGRWFDFLLVFLLLFISTLHGIKFTIIHAFLFFILSYYFSAGFRLNVYVCIISSILVLVIFAFFSLIRGGGWEGVFGYIFSASINSMYLINEVPFYEISTLNIFNPLSVIPFDRLLSRIVEDLSFSMQVDSFLLNDAYNLEHYVTQVGLGVGSGMIVYSVFFAAIIKSIIRKPLLDYVDLYLIVFVTYVLLMGFTAFEFFKFKLWFGFLALFIYRLLNRFNFRSARCFP